MNIAMRETVYACYRNYDGSKSHIPAGFIDMQEDNLDWLNFSVYMLPCPVPESHYNKDTAMYHLYIFGGEIARLLEKRRRRMFVSYSYGKSAVRAGFARPFFMKHNVYYKLLVSSVPTPNYIEMEDTKQMIGLWNFALANRLFQKPTDIIKRHKDVNPVRTCAEITEFMKRYEEGLSIEQSQQQNLNLLKEFPL